MKYSTILAPSLWKSMRGPCTHINQNTMKINLFQNLPIYISLSFNKVKTSNHCLICLSVNRYPPWFFSKILKSVNCPLICSTWRIPREHPHCTPLLQRGVCVRKNYVPKLSSTLGMWTAPLAFAWPQILGNWHCIRCLECHRNWHN